MADIAWEVLSLADQVRAHLREGDFAGLGPVEFDSGDIVQNAELAAKITLADVDHCFALAQRNKTAFPCSSWVRLARDLRHLLQLLIGGERA